TYVWFKSGFPVVLHSHSADCVYYITAGSIRLGTETLGPGDGFFVPYDGPYSYTAGPDGVELMEFRNSNRFDLKFQATNPTYWERALQAVHARKADWASETRPSARGKAVPV